MELVPDRPNYDTTLALDEITAAIRASDSHLENERASRATLRSALGLITRLFKEFDVHMVGGDPLPDVWQMNREQVVSSDSVLKIGVTAATEHLRNNPGDTAGAARILDACQITADLFTVKAG